MPITSLPKTGSQLSKQILVSQEGTGAYTLQTLCTSLQVQQLECPNFNTPHREKWTELFGSNVALAPDLPFWGTDNLRNDPSLATYTRPIVGGWPRMVAKQYNTQDTTKGDAGKITADGCGFSVDLDSFDPSYEQIAVSTGQGSGQPQPCTTTADGLRYRTCPHANDNCPAMGQYTLGASINFICETGGDLIPGDWSTKYVPSPHSHRHPSNQTFPRRSLWGRTEAGYYVSLAYVDQDCASRCPFIPCGRIGGLTGSFHNQRIFPLAHLRVGDKRGYGVDL